MRTLAVLAAVGLLGCSAPAFAEMQKFTADLKADSEVPPHPGLKGAGHVDATFDTDTKTLSWTADYSGLTGPATMAHFHGPAPVGKNAGVMVPLKDPLDSPVKGSAVLTGDQVKALEAGNMYFNVHTAANKGGEIRGQVEKAM